jgi:2-amino-4-hydroxy-6-hydroxymethyldihydropteridine diphosphokinase
MRAREHGVCLLLGSNIQPGENLARGLDLLRQKVKVARLSSVWETPPVGASGPNFLNLAVLIKTSMEAGELKEKILRPLETRLGRVRSADQNAPRPIDIDIVIFDGQLLDADLFRYAHRAVPVAEILPDFRSNTGELLHEVSCRLVETSPIRLKAETMKGLNNI